MTTIEDTESHHAMRTDTSGNVQDNKVMHGNERWTSDILKNIQKYDAEGLKIQIRQFQLTESAPSTMPKHIPPVEICKCHQNTTEYKTTKVLQPIRESEFEDVSHDYSLGEVEYKISNASCNKRKRGWQRKYNIRVAKLNKDSDLRGLIKCQIRSQNDTGATHNLTNNQNILRHFQCIKPIAIDGINDNGPTLYATGLGYLPITFADGEILLVECLYSPQASSTLLSPTAMAIQHQTTFSGWSIHANIDNNSGYMQLINRDGINHAIIPMYSENRLWYHYLETNIQPNIKPVVRRLSTKSEYELWHHRLGHPNASTMQKMHKFARGIPKLRQPEFHKCQSCLLCKIKKQNKSPIKTSEPKEIKPEEKLRVGQHLHMDFGFLRGSEFSAKDVLECWSQ